LSEIFTILETSNNPNVALESREIDHAIQKHIILDEIPKLINLLHKWAEDPTTSTHSLRFFAHLVLFFESVGDTNDKKICESVIEA
jgi:nuclear pore complex protein Nup107